MCNDDARASENKNGETNAYPRRHNQSNHLAQLSVTHLLDSHNPPSDPMLSPTPSLRQYGFKTPGIYDHSLGNDYQLMFCVHLTMKSIAVRQAALCITRRRHCQELKVPWLNTPLIIWPLVSIGPSSSKVSEFSLGVLPSKSPQVRKSVKHGFRKYCETSTWKSNAAFLSFNTLIDEDIYVCRGSHLATDTECPLLLECQDSRVDTITTYASLPFADM